MDPMSAIGLVGSVVGVLDVVTRSVNKLSSLRTKFRRADFFVSALHGHLCVVQAALHELAERLRAEHPNFLQPKEKVQTALETSLEGCGILVASFEEQLDKFRDEGDAQMTAQGKLSFLWHDRDVKDYLDLLDRHVNALNLLLQVIQCRTHPEQTDLLQEDDSLTVLRLARECTESLYEVNDAESRKGRSSILSETTTRLSLTFAFDSQILGSRVYQQASRSNVRNLIRNRSPRQIQTKQSNDNNIDQGKPRAWALELSEPPDAIVRQVNKPLPGLPRDLHDPNIASARQSVHSVRSVASTVMTRASNMIDIAFIPGITDEQGQENDTVSSVPPVSGLEGGETERPTSLPPLLERAIAMANDIERRDRESIDSDYTNHQGRADVSQPVMIENSLGWI